jgi:hypothetical protein
MEQEEDGKGSLVDRVIRVILAKAARLPEAGPLDQNSTAIVWHIASRTSFAEMASEMKVLNYASSADYAGRVLWPRLAKLAARQRVVRERTALVETEDQA